MVSLSSKIGQTPMNTANIIKYVSLVGKVLTETSILSRPTYLNNSMPS